MSLSLILQSIETLALVTGVAFGLIQLRQLRVQREAQGGAELLRSLQSPQMARASLLLYELPENLSRTELKEKLGDDFEAVCGLVGIFESMGPLVARGHMSLDMYADFYRGATVLCWRKLRRYAKEQRADGWTNLFEWFQWLAERMEKCPPFADDPPAHEKYRDWKRPADYKKLRKAYGGAAARLSLK